ncbi:MAG: hypothetical protein ABIO49_00375 [Dokdonella sp.]
MNILAVPRTVALVSSALCLCASIAAAQSPPTATAQTAPPLQLQVPTPPLDAVAPAGTSDNAIVDAQDSAADERAHAPKVHGSVTTGIGYSKGYGTSTTSAADLDIGGQSDSGRSYDVHLQLMQSKGPGFGYYGVPSGRFREPE